MNDYFLEHVFVCDYGCYIFKLIVTLWGGGGTLTLEVHRKKYVFVPSTTTAN